MTCPFLNFQVGVGQRWEKSVPSNLFRIAGIPVNRSLDKRGQTIFGTDNGIVLIVKRCKNSKLSLLSGTAHLLRHNRCLFLRTWCRKDT